MVGRPGGGRFRVSVLLIAGIALGASEPRRERFEDVDVYGSYALLSAAKIKIGDAAQVDGNVHTNDSIELRKNSLVRGDVSAVREVKNAGGVVTGSVTQRAAAVPLPSMPDKNAIRAQANRILTGPVKLTAPVVDDVLYVNGAVTIQGEASGSGTLIATGAVTVAPAASGGAAPPPAALGKRLSILAYADVTFQARSTLRATVRAKGRALLGELATFDGSIVADRDIELARAAMARFAPPADSVAPSLTILGPSDPWVTAEPTVDLTVLYADADPGVDPASFALRSDGSVATDRCSVGPSVAICSLALASSGRHDFVATIRDRAGNLATGTLSFTARLDAAPPSIAIESPAPGALVATAGIVVTGTVTDDGRVEQVTLGSTPLTVANGRFTGSVALQEGSNVLNVVARDAVGRVSEATVDVVRDSEPPRVSLRSPEAPATSPPGGATLTVGTTVHSIVVAGSAEDENGVATVEVGGVSVPVASGDFERSVDLAEGVNRVRVAAYDRAGNVGAVEIEVERRNVPAITIVEPVDGVVVFERSTAVRGTVDVAGSTVVVNGHAAAVSGSSFALDELPLVDGATLINVVATSPSGLESSAGVTVLRDVDAPIVSIHEPADGSTVYASMIAVTGLVNDVVVGTVNGAQVEVTVNGTAAEVSNRSFLLDRLALAPGDNTIEVSAVDPSGNVGRDVVMVRRVVTNGPVLSAVSGDGQTGVMGEALALPLVVVLRDARGVPLPGRAVSFLADGTDGVFAGGKRQFAVNTDFAGRASVQLTLGRRAGHHTVRAMSTGVEGVAVFVARALPAEPRVVVVDSGDQQVGATGQPLRAPFAAVVTDDGFNRLAGAVVRFEVIDGGGTLDGGEQVLDLAADSDGRVTTRLTLGLDEGVGNNVVRARLVDGPPEAEVTFTASAMVADDPAATSVSGVVLDNSDVPVPGATVSLEGTTLSTRTDAVGYFRLDGAPVGTTHLRVRGATVERPGVWPSLEFLITVVAGRDNSMGRPIYLPVLDLANALAVDEDSGGVLTMHDLPGFALEIEPGAVTFPGGGRSGVITVTPVHSDKVPMPPNFGQQPRFVITIQPGGAHFDPPARVTFPNVDGLSPGQVTELYSFDHDLARFVSIGPGTVTGDGTRIVSDRGVGIAKAGWHGGGDPARPGTCHNCGECKSPAGGACVADDAKTPKQRAPDDCKVDRCSGGRLVSSPTNQEPATQNAGNCFEELCPPQKHNLDLGDAPPGSKCCGDPTKPLPNGAGFGVLAGTYAPQDECCVPSGIGNERTIIAKRAPIDLRLCPKLKEPETSIEITYSGCSVPVILDAILEVAGLYPPYSGNPNEPTPPANGQALFSEVGNSATPNKACDSHDRCYQSCGEGRGDCDDTFAEDLKATCHGVTGIVAGVDPQTGQPANFDRNEVCMAWAGLYSFVVDGTGERAYREGQSSHCDCECS